MNQTYLETIKSEDGQICNIEYHQARYESVLDSLGIKRKQDLSDHIKPPKSGVYRCRVVYSEDILEVTYYKYERRNISSLKLVYDDKIDYRYKSTDRKRLEELFTLKDECDDVLIVKNSLITDTTIANIAFLIDGVWITPKQPLLKGTTRARLLDEGSLVEADIGVDELKRISKVALLNAMIGFDILKNCKFLI